MNTSRGTGDQLDPAGLGMVGMRRRNRLGIGVTARPLAWSAVVCTTLCAFVARPAYADPAGNEVPDAGTRPVPAGGLPLPVGGASTGQVPTGPVVLGPLAQQLLAQRTATEQLGEQLKQAEIDVTRAHEATLATQSAWTEASARTALVAAEVAKEADEAYRAAAALGPLDQYATDLHELSVLAPGLGDQPGAEAPGRRLARAEQAEQQAFQAYQAAGQAEQQATTHHDQLKQDFAKAQAALADLTSRNASEIARIEAERDRAELSLAASINLSASVDGQLPNPKALAAVTWAWNKRGSRYVWGTEGPDTFDCSGLVWAAYRSVGVTLPRVANDQYHATTPVPVSKLLRGDLLFFATDKSDWRTIHHVGIYLGSGLMLHAPTTGDVVKVSPVWWSEFFGATRVLPAVSVPTTQPPAPAPPPAPPPPPSPAPPPPSPSPSTSPTPSTSPSPSTSGSASPSTTTSSSSGGSASPASSTSAGSASPSSIEPSTTSTSSTSGSASPTAS